MKPSESLHRLNTQDVGPEMKKDVAFEFDPKKEVNEDDWSGIVQKLLSLRATDDWEEFARLAFRTFDIDPIRTRSLIKDADWVHMIDGLKASRLVGAWRGFAEFASCMSTIDPERTRSLMKDTDWAHMIDEFKYFRTYGDWHYFTWTASSLTRLSHSLMTTPTIPIRSFPTVKKY